MTAAAGESDAFVFFGATGDLAYRQIDVVDRVPRLRKPASTWKIG